jgi:hypothetical protein
VPTVEVKVRYMNALRQAVGLHIDPETAEVDCIYAQTLDPMATSSQSPGGIPTSRERILRPLSWK